MSEIDEIYKPAEAKDQAAKAALARKLLEDGRKNEAKPAEQFVLLRRAGEKARDAGEPDLMLETVDAILAAGFDIRPYKAKSRLLKQLVAQTASDNSRLSTVSASCAKFAEDAAASGAVDEASEVLEEAKKSLSKAGIRAQADLRTAKVALARARTVADKAERQTKVDDAQAEVDAIKLAQSALIECAKGLQQSRREHEAIQAALKKLSTVPDDPEACEVVGRWYCFQQGNWDDGLKLLAKGSNGALKSLAAEELGSKPSKADDKVARGDAWWDSAETVKGTPKAAMRRHAGQWYQEALTDLAPCLGKARVEKRLAEAVDQSAPEAMGEAARPHPPLAIAPFNEKTAKQLQVRWARYLHVPVVETNSIGMNLVLIPPGEFQMGSPKELIEDELRLHHGSAGSYEAWYSSALPNEAPQHRVRITKPYWLGATDVTQEEFQRVMRSNPSKFQGDPKNPVEQVSWDDAVEFCRRLSELPGERAAKRRYGLPTEAQWEHTCRAGTTTRWDSGDDEAGLVDVAWSVANAGGQTHPVGEKKPNTWGLYDMHGNVWDWCQDWFEKDYYAKSPTDDPAGSSAGSGRVYRGGSELQAAFRISGSRAGADIGFRVSLVLADK
jgi:formylglycine-generating enzyme required for sulfatase activity